MEKKITAILLAAGSGSRMKSEIKKQYMELAGKPVLYYSLKALEESRVDEIILVVSGEDIEFCRKELVEKYGFTKVSHIAEGGKQRWESVEHGICHAGGEYCLIHDGARPCIHPELIDAFIAKGQTQDGMILAVPVKDTIKIVDEEKNITQTPDREQLYAAQTPQMFRTELLRQVYASMHRDPEPEITFTDDAVLVQHYAGVKVKIFPGEYTNIKVTTPEDMELAELFLERK
ncbi:MAG: 2-C-methyl-D-erythritol 4-phosphate cytidylyltransferase [Lachnospiraceae bacterium]